MGKWKEERKQTSQRNLTTPTQMGGEQELPKTKLKRRTFGWGGMGGQTLVAVSAKIRCVVLNHLDAFSLNSYMQGAEGARWV